jgi:hypothetical protein
MTEQVNYNKMVWAQAMSKNPNQKGLIVRDDYLSDGSLISLHGVNAKDGKQTSHLRLQIPKESIGDVIEMLKKFL